MVNEAGPRKGAIQDEHHERRKHLRVDAPLKARCLDAEGNEYPCLVVNISAGGALFRAKRAPAFGENVVVYVDRLGRFEGRVIRSGAKSFAVNYEKKRAKNAKTADNLTEVLHQGRRSHDRRASPRIKQDAPAQVFFEDGRVADCAILDISLTGASLEISPRPALGTRLILGRMTAKVVRRHENGVGVVFTGAAEKEKMSDVIGEATAPAAEPISGAPVAKPFGKRNG